MTDTPRIRRASTGRLLLAFALVALAAASACNERAKEVRPTSPPSATPRFVGRFDFSDPAGPRFAWSTSTIEASFTGTALAMRLRAEPLEPHDVKIDGKRVTLHETTTSYTVRIDDRSPFTIQVGPTRERYELARDLDPSRGHTISVTRDAEAFAGVHQFLGFDVQGGALVPPRARSLRIEIVGDSITCGYGILGKDASCPFTYDTESASLAYGALLGRALDADVTTVCWSGRGIYRNYDIDGEPTMPELFELAVPVPKGKPVRWAFDAAPKPHATVIHLGANDFFADGNGDGKPEPIDHAAFEQAFARFLARVRAVAAGGPILVALAPMLRGALREDARATLRRVVQARRATGDDRVELLELEEQGTRVGCDSHPNAEMHRVLARQVEVALRAALAGGLPEPTDAGVVAEPRARTCPALPVARPSDLVIGVSRHIVPHGGPVEKHRAELTESQATCLTNLAPGAAPAYACLTVTAAELDELWREFRTRSFTAMRSRAGGMSPHYGGRFLWLRWAGRYACEVGDSSGAKLDGAYDRDFSALVDAVESAGRKHL